MRWWRAAALVTVGVVAAGCSSSSSTSTTGATTSSTVAGSVPASIPVTDPPRVDLIAPAIAALDARLGGPQEYFEVNATSKLVNLWVALNDGTIAQSWVYLDGELTSQSGQDAQGASFAGSAVSFDASTVLSQVQRDLPAATIDLFLIEGGPNGTVRYTAVLTSELGGQLQIVVGPDGKVLEVDAGAGAGAGTAPSTTTG